MEPYYQAGGISIYHADCRRLLPTLNADVVVTDPPYGIGANSNRTGPQFRIENDDGSLDETVEWLRLRWPIVIFASPYRPFPGKWKSLLVWDKGPGVGGNGAINLWKRSWELVQVDLKKRGMRGSRDTAVLPYWVGPWHRVGFENQVHPATKPVPLLEYLILKTTEHSECVLDPFMGSGSTLSAARNLGRRAIGIEVEERWCELAAKALSRSSEGPPA